MRMRTASIKEAKSRLTALAREVEKGDTIVVTRNGKPIFDLVPHRKKGGLDLEALREFNREHGLSTIFAYVSEDFDEPLPEDFLIRPLPWVVRLLLDRNILIALVDEQVDRLAGAMRGGLTESDAALHVSVASLWEIAIKVPLGRLNHRMSPKLLPDFAHWTGLQIIPIDHRDVLAVVEPAPATRDPLDLLLLAQCMVENLCLVTLDRALAAHRSLGAPAEDRSGGKRQSQEVPKKGSSLSGRRRSCSRLHAVPRRKAVKRAGRPR
jgi:prevent-host-death family protein